MTVRNSDTAVFTNSVVLLPPSPVLSPSLQACCAQVQAALQHNRLAEAWAMLASLIDGHAPHPEVYKLQGAVLVAAGLHVQALGCFQASLALAPHNNGQSLALAGGCLHILGRLPEAVTYFRAALQAQCAAPIRLMTPYSSPPFDNAAAERRLWEALTRLASAGIHAFATSGTLLGLQREGRLLPFDKDLDVGIPFAEMGRATQLLVSSGWHRARSPQGMINPIMLHDGKGLSIDLCGFVAESGTNAALGGFWLKGAPPDWQRVAQYPVLHLHERPCPTGQMVWAVTNPHAWLSALYGPNWQVPDPNFDTVIAAHNLRGFAVLTQCYAFSRIYERWLHGLLEKATALTGQALRHVPQDALLLRVQQCLAEQQAPQTRGQAKTTPGTGADLKVCTPIV